MTPLLKEGISELENAVAVGTMGSAGEATKHAESAVLHLKQVK